MKFLETLSTKCLAIAGGILFLFFYIYSLVYTIYFETNHSIIPSEIADSPLQTGAAVLLFLITLYLCKVMLDRTEKGRKLIFRSLPVLTAAFAAVFSLLWIHIAKSMIVADQRSVCFLAEELLTGKTNEENLQYLQTWPHQSGLILFVEGVYLLFGVGNWEMVKYVNVIGVVGCVLAGYGIVRRLNQKKEASCIYCLLCLGCIPLYIYTSFVYGEILSLFFALLAILGLLLYLEREKLRYLVMLGFSISVSIMLRSNNYIVLIGILCVWAVSVLSKKKWKSLFYMIPVILCVLFCKKASVRACEVQSKLDLRSGMPSSLWVAMGMQEGTRAAGWWNDYTTKVYQEEAQMDPEAADKIAKASIAQSLHNFWENPSYALDFYKRKLVSQWNDPTYECQVSTNPRDVERGALGDSLYKGELRSVLQQFMNIYQSVIYGGILLFFLLKSKEKGKVETYILFVVILGGVLFHQLWEAQSRYVFPYFVMMLPMAALGIQSLFDKMETLRRK